jgi:hypothetical protein
LASHFRVGQAKPKALERLIIAAKIIWSVGLSPSPASSWGTTVKFKFGEALVAAALSGIPGPLFFSKETQKRLDRGPTMN